MGGWGPAAAGRLKLDGRTPVKTPGARAARKKAKEKQSDYKEATAVEPLSISGELVEMCGYTRRMQPTSVVASVQLFARKRLFRRLS